MVWAVALVLEAVCMLQEEYQVLHQVTRLGTPKDRLQVMLRDRLRAMAMARHRVMATEGPEQALEATVMESNSPLLPIF